ncbi:MAG TPA: peptidylprolyl isomerase [Polyangiaceae bacterium]|nr:peptidylprolyl isomerase [Polyangiaceae bacterium]
MQRSTWAVLGVLLAAGIFLVVRGRTDKIPERAAEVTSASDKAPPPRPEPSGEPAVPTVPAPSSSAPVPELPKDAPQNVSFGVVVVSFRGAEDAPPNARDRASALALAKELVPVAQKDFDEAVKRGDRGSMADAGSIPRGVLEPPLEYALFTLKKGQVYGEPLESPRGYWILRRN